MSPTAGGGPPAPASVSASDTCETADGTLTVRMYPALPVWGGRAAKSSPGAASTVSVTPFTWSTRRGAWERGATGWVGREEKPSQRRPLLPNPRRLFSPPPFPTHLRQEPLPRAHVAQRDPRALGDGTDEDAVRAELQNQRRSSPSSSSSSSSSGAATRDGLGSSQRHEHLRLAVRVRDRVRRAEVRKDVSREAEDAASEEHDRRGGSARVTGKAAGLRRGAAECVVLCKLGQRAVVSKDDGVELGQGRRGKRVAGQHPDWHVVERLQPRHSGLITSGADMNGAQEKIGREVGRNYACRVVHSQAARRREQNILGCARDRVRAIVTTRKWKTLLPVSTPDPVMPTMRTSMRLSFAKASP